MAKYCVVAPLQVLEPLSHSGRFPTNHLLLAHDIVENEERYLRLFNNRYRYKLNIPEHRFEYVILDNSVIETGNAVDMDTILKAAEIVRPSCIVLPDILEDGPATAESCTKALVEWGEAINKKFGMDDLKMRSLPFLFIPQGKSLEEFTACAETLARSERIQYWGVPRNLVKHLGTRQQAIQVVQMLNQRRYIHMMGFSDDMIDDALCAQFLDVDTIDSAVPVRCPTPFTLTSKLPPRGNWWQDAVYSLRMHDNIEAAKKLFDS